MPTFTTRQNEFRCNLKKVIRCFPLDSSHELVRFRITPVDEPGKTVSSIDDVMELWIFRKIDLSNKLFDTEEAVQFLTAHTDKFPLWIKVKLGDDGIIELMISKRFRPFKELLNQGTGHPPFELVE